MPSDSSKTKRRWLLAASSVAVLLVGVLLRFKLAGIGHNFDFDSWMIVGDIVEGGGNVYAETFRYNYGPVWFMILGGLRHLVDIFNLSPEYYRYGIIAVLTLVDIGLWAFLKKYFGRWAAAIFFLMPISVIISGYHHQFDNLAILLGLLSVVVFGDVKDRLTKRNYAGLALLGLSLATKHLFFAFPFWLAIRQKRLSHKLLVLIVPLAIFGLSFLPFWSVGHDGIIHNVLLYGSFKNAPFWYTMVPHFLQSVLTPHILFYGSLLIFGFVFRKRDLLESALLYTFVLVIFAPAIANQYLAIVMPAVAVFMNGFLIVYAAYASLLLLVSQAGLYVEWLLNNLPHWLVGPVSPDAGMRAYDPMVVLLFFGFMWVLAGKQLKSGLGKLGRWGRAEIKFQAKSLRP